MEHKITRVNLYQNTKNAIFTNTAIAAMTAISSVIAAGGATAGGYAAITNLNDPNSVLVYALMSLAVAGVSVGAFKASINSLKNIKNILRLKKEMTDELENTSVEDEEKILLKYYEILDGGAYSLNKRYKK